MSTSQAVVQHLPFLRRYARALTGSQASGDAYVAAALESLILEPKSLESLPNTRVALYRLFTKIWNSVTLNGKADATTAPHLTPDLHITQLTPRPRQAFLLVALEGFSEDEAAQILGGRPSDAARLGRGIRPRACGRDRDRRPDYRGRDLHRHGHRGSGRKSRPSGASASRAPTRGGRAGQVRSGPASSWPISSWPTAARASMPSTNCWPRSRCRSSSSPPIRSASSPGSGRSRPS